MNYPVWDVAFGAGLLIAAVSILHVFVSHFAVGGGLFLVLTEKRAYRTSDGELLKWLKRHTKFFVLVTVVFGAVSGVGIWFTIGLINPSSTSSLIHSFVWGWAIEWVFFFLEITAALLYMYGWNKMDRRVFAADPATGLVMGLSHFSHSMDKGPYEVTYMDGSTGTYEANFGFDPFDLPAAHIFKIGADGLVREIEAMGFGAPYNAPTGWE